MVLNSQRHDSLHVVIRKRQARVESVDPREAFTCKYRLQTGRRKERRRLQTQPPTRLWNSWKTLWFGFLRQSACTGGWTSSHQESHKDLSNPFNRLEDMGITLGTALWVLTKGASAYSLLLRTLWKVPPSYIHCMFISMSLDVWRFDLCY